MLYLAVHLAWHATLTAEERDAVRHVIVRTRLTHPSSHRRTIVTTGRLEEEGGGG